MSKSEGEGILQFIIVNPFLALSGFYFWSMEVSLKLEVFLKNISRFIYLKEKAHVGGLWFAGPLPKCPQQPRPGWDWSQKHRVPSSFLSCGRNSVTLSHGLCLQGSAVMEPTVRSCSQGVNPGTLPWDAGISATRQNARSLELKSPLLSALYNLNFIFYS